MTTGHAVFGWVAFAVGLGGCGGYNQEFGGSPVWQMFPFDGERTWDYISTDTALPYKTIVTSVDEPEVVGGTNVYALTYVTECFGASETCVDGTVIRRMQWSSTVSDGVFIYSYDSGDGYVELDPPLHFAEDSAKKGDAIVTETAGATWTSTMQGIEACPIRLTADWPECGLFEVTVDVGEGYPLVGKYWATKGNGIAAFELATEAGQWQLSDIDCQGECDGKW